MTKWKAWFQFVRTRGVHLCLTGACVASIHIGCSEPTGPDAEAYACDARAPDDAQMHPLSEELAGALASTARRLPGAVWHVSDRNGSWTGAVGYADLAVRAPMRTCTPHRIASVTKSVVATTVLLLVEAGHLELDDPIEWWLPETVNRWYVRTGDVTVRDLLNHTSGYKRFFDVQWGIDYFNDPTQRWTTREMLRDAGVRGREAAPPGAVHAYSNANYLLLAEIIETVTGQPHEAVIRDRVLSPLQLERTTYTPDTFTFPAGTARGYMELYGAGDLIDATDTYALTAVGADGGIISTADELGAFLRAVFSERTLLSEQSLEAAQEWVANDSDDFPLYGLGFDVWRTAHGDGVGHVGQEFGYLTIAYYFAERDLVFVFTTNASSLEEPVNGNLTYHVFEDVLPALLDVVFQATE